MANLIKNNTMTEKLIVKGDMIFYVQFIIKNNSIQIECNKTNSNEKYINTLSLEDWKDFNSYLFSLNNLSNIFKQIEKLDNQEFSIVNEKNQIKLNFNFYDKYQKYPITITLDENKNNKFKDSESKIIEENNILKNKNKSLEERIEFLEDYINKFKLSLPYNSFDINLYELEKVYNNLNSDLITKREHLGLINSGIKKLLKTNIADCILTYKFIKEENKNIPKKFREICENLSNILIIIKTSNLKTFGAFYKKDINDNYINNNNYNGNYNNIIENLFDSKKYTKNAFVFSLDKSKIYYSDLSCKDSYENPGFLINYNNNEYYLFGIEYKEDNVNNQNRQKIIVNEVRHIKMTQYENKQSTIPNIKTQQYQNSSNKNINSIRSNINQYNQNNIMSTGDGFGNNEDVTYSTSNLGYAGGAGGHGGNRAAMQVAEYAGGAGYGYSALGEMPNRNNLGYINNNDVQNYINNSDNQSYILSELSKFAIFNLEVFSINIYK